MGINLSKAVRANLLSLQATAAAMARTQERLSTGLKVNSALDNPSSFFTATALKSRASDMANLLDGMSNGIKTLEAADNGLKAITRTVESMQSTLRQARQDKSFKSESYELAFPATPAGTETLTLSGGAVGSPVTIGLTSATTADTLVTEINGNGALNRAVRASNDNGRLRIENLSTGTLTVGGVSPGGQLTGIANAVTIGGNDVRRSLAEQFNDLRDQFDKFADDASFNGINLLRGDLLTLTFNETGTSSIDIQARDASGVASSISNQTLGIAEAGAGAFDSDEAIDARLEVLKTALGTLRSQASAFGSNLSIVESRTDFTKAMIKTLETGAAELTLADANEEAANLLALQTRQQLSSTALSMASLADHAVLRLFS